MATNNEQTSFGLKKLTHTNSTNLESIPVTVKRQDSTIENVMLMDELLAFVDAQFPNAVNKYLAHPQAFEYNYKALNNTHGFLKEAQERPDIGWQWRRRATGDLSEAKTFRALETLFQKRQSLLINGFKTETIFKVLRESAERSKKQIQKSKKMFSRPLTNEERMFKEASGIDLLELETQLKSLIVASATPQSANISEEDLILTITSQTEAPGMHLLDEDGKVKYVKTLNREVIQMFKKSKRDLAPDEVVFHLIRSLLNFIEKNNEFDFLLGQGYQHLRSSGGEEFSSGGESRWRNP